MVQKSPPPNRPLVVRLSGRCVFGIFEAFAKIGPNSHQTTRKIEVSEKLSQCLKRRFWDGGVSGPEKGPFRKRSCWPWFPLLKCSVLQPEAFLGPKNLHWGTKFPSYSICIYAHTSAHARTHTQRDTQTHRQADTQSQTHNHKHMNLHTHTLSLSLSLSLSLRLREWQHFPPPQEG